MNGQNSSPGVIGIFDSGLGGLSVWREIVRQLPHENTLYVADQAHVPYGSRSLAEVQRFCDGITCFLLEQGAKLIVIACNAASAAALLYLRSRFPDVPFVGMEPAIKPAAQQTRTGIVGVIATQATFQGQLFASLLAAYGSRVQILTRVGHGWVETVEAGALDSTETEALVRDCAKPLICAGADHLVLGCTHYPFLQPVIQRLLGPGVAIIDPAPAVALQSSRVLAQHGLTNGRDRSGQHRFCTSGERSRFGTSLRHLLPALDQDISITAVSWQAGRLELVP